MFYNIAEYCLQEDPKLILETWNWDTAVDLTEQHQLIALKRFSVDHHNNHKKRWVAWPQNEVTKHWIM